MLRFTSIVLILAGTIACSSDDQPDSTTPVDSGPSPDAGVIPDLGQDIDMGQLDMGEPDMGVEPDAGPPDMGIVQDIRIPDLTGEVSAMFDDSGVLHLRCANDLDCFAVQGYFHASHRFGQMDLRRRLASGRLSEVFGVITLDSDRTFRHFIATQDGQRMQDRLWTMASDESRAMVEAYTRGVNAWIDDLRNDRNGAQLTFEYAHLIDKIADWAPQDSVACILALIEDLSNQSNTELALSMVLPQVPVEQAFDLYGLRPSSPSSILAPTASLRADGFSLASLELLRDAQARLQPSVHALGIARDYLSPLGETPSGFGSNNWVLSGQLTDTGNALLANDPHLNLSNPSTWYLVNLDAKTTGTGLVHAAGVSFAGLPGIILGQNEEIAWGATTTFFDLADVYVETLNQAGDAVMFNGMEVPIVERQFTFEVDGNQPITETFRYVPHHGPLISEDPMTGTAISVRWSGHQATTDLDVIWDMMTAQTVTQAKTALSKVTTIAQNWVVIDNGGNIGWFPYNGVPNRPWASAQLPPWLPLPGDGSAEWEGLLDLNVLPQAENPGEGFIATANNDMTGALIDGDPTDDGAPMFQHFVAEGYRHESIVQRIIDGGNGHSMQTMSEIQADVFSLLGERVVPIISAAAQPRLDALSAEGAAVLNALDGWNFQCPTGLTGIDPEGPKDPDAKQASASIGCAAFHVLWPRLREATFADEVASYGVTRRANTSAMVIALERPMELAGGDVYWDDISTPMVTETQTDTVVAAIESAGAYLAAELGADPDDWRWGRLHTVTLRADFFDTAGIRMYNNGPYANDGGLYTIDVANPSGQFGDNYAHTSGPSMRFVCEAASPVTCTIEIPGGQRNFPQSPYYENLLLDWLENSSIPLNFTSLEVDAAAIETLQVQAP